MSSMLHSFLSLVAGLFFVVCCFASPLFTGALELQAADVEWDIDQEKLSADLRRAELADALKAVGGRM